MQHHAYLYEGSQDLLESLIISAKQVFNFEGSGNPDLHVESFEKFLIDDAHELTRSAQLKSVSGRSLFILGVASINAQAQQALLKLFEEPQPGVTFVLLVPPGIVLPTLRSRLMQYPDKGSTLAQGSSRSNLKARSDLAIAEEFLAASYKARSTQVAALLKDEEHTKERVRSFISSLEQLMYQKLTVSHGAKEYRAALEDIAKVRDYLGDQSPSLKMLLEHLAATLPVV